MVEVRRGGLVYFRIFVGFKCYSNLKGVDSLVCSMCRHYAFRIKLAKFWV